jgi:plastocyanin
MTTRTRTTAMTLAAVVILIAPACGQSNVNQGSNASSAPEAASSSAAPSAPAAATAATISIDGFKYTDVTVPAGAQITVVNNDSAEHTVTSDTSGAFNVEVEGRHKATFTAPTQPGTYPFHCTYHPSMHGMLTVQ